MYLRPNECTYECGNCRSFAGRKKKSYSEIEPVHVAIVIQNIRCFNIDSFFKSKNLDSRTTLCRRTLIRTILSSFSQFSMTHRCNKHWFDLIGDKFLYLLRGRDASR